ncbi:MAG: signal peptidase I [Armatimonadetes bacterium]|nr:signal peptidase I [Armatimonadota bacterium]
MFSDFNTHKKHNLLFRKKQKVTLSKKVKYIVKEYIDSIIFAGITALIIVQFIVRPFYIPSESMLPTLQKWDFILVNEFVYRFHLPEKGDIVVFHPPPSAFAGDKEYIKRIIAKSGDTFEVKEGKVYLNGAPRYEPYIYTPCDYDYPKTIIPPGHFFVMGDNRSNSGDSHIWGFLPQKNIVGKAFVIFWPPWRIKILK